MIYRFGPFELDEVAGELRRDGRSVEVQPKPLSLLALLIRERARVVSTDEILDALWPGTVVTPSSLTRAVSVARRAIGDAHKGAMIRSYARRGYRFCGDVVVRERAGGRATGAPDPGARALASAGVSGADPFIGRTDALERLRDAWEKAASGQGSMAIVAGAPGIGKTRLAEVLMDEVAGAGALVLVGRSRDGEGVPALWLWAQVLRQLVERGDAGRDLRERAAACAELAGLLPELEIPAHAARADASPEQGRFALFDAVAQALAAASRRRPILVVLEDLQWAGTASLRLLEHVAFAQGGDPLLVVATVRDEPRDRADPVERTLQTLHAQPRAVRIDLRGFTRGEVAALAERRLGRPAPPDLTSELAARTAGVPLLVREALRVLADRGDLRHPDRIRHWTVSLPDHALDLVRRPLDRLSPRAAELVTAASVLGHEFPLALASALSGIPREEALDLLDEAQAAGVLGPAPDAPAAWRFVHALIQDAAYASLAAGRRARLHHRAAVEIERRHHDDPDRVVAELAHHHHEALALGHSERAYACAVRAAERAARLCAHEQAALHQRQALAALESAESVDGDRRLATLLAYGEALHRAGERERRREIFTAAAEAARALGRPVELARAAIGFCDLSEWAPRDDEGRMLLEEALAALGPDHAATRARVLTRLAYLGARERFDEAEPTAREAVRIARQLDDPASLQDALYVLFFLLAGPDHLEERESIGREVLAIARSSGAHDPSLITVLDVACDRLMVGDAAGARRQREVAEEVAGAAPHPGRAWHLRVYESGIAALEGRFADALRRADEATALGRRIGHPYARGVERALRAVLARDRGDEAEVLRVFDPRLPIRVGPAQWVQAFAARALCTVGRDAEARALFDDLAAHGFERIPRNIRWHVTVVETANLCADLGDAARAPALVALLSPVEHHHGVLPMPVCYGGPVSRCLARLYDLLGRPDDAEDLFASAIEACGALGARPMEARTRAELGALLTRRGDRRRGRDELLRAAGIAAELGMPEVEGRARSLLQRHAV